MRGYSNVVHSHPIRPTIKTKNQNDELSVYMSQMSFFQPNLVIDVRNGRLWEIELRLDQMPPLFENEELSLRFLLRRKFNKSVIFNLFRRAIATSDTVGIERLCRLFDQLTQKMKQGRSKSISQAELCLHVFQPLASEKTITYKTLS